MIDRQNGTLVIGSLTRIIVPVARSLHCRGIPVHGASLGACKSKLPSRALRSFTCLPDPDVQPESFFSKLTAVIEEHQIDTVLPCGDEVLLALAAHDKDLRCLVHYCAPSPEICAKILDKRKTLDIAAECGLDIPAEYDIADVGALLRDPMRFRFPLVLKPRAKNFEEQTEIKNVIVNSFEDLESYFGKHPRLGEWFLFQEYVPGEGVAVDVLMDQGRPSVLFQHRRVREFPIRGGVSVVAQSESVDPRLACQAVTLLRELNWQGAAMVEFRRDPATGRTALMEVNGRFWGSIALPLACGITFPFYVWQLAHGRQISAPSTYPAGVRFRWLAGDIKRLSESIFSPATSPFIAARQFLQDFLPPSKDAVWMWSDPLPSLDEAFRAIVSSAFMAGGAIARKLLSARSHHLLRHLRRVGVSASLKYLKCRSSRIRGVDVKSLERVQSIAFICHGNIIRSPIAEAILSTFDLNIEIRSAGTEASPGREADRRAIQCAKEAGLSLEAHRATKVSADLVERTDLLVVMDYLNYLSLTEVFPDAEPKTALLGSVGRKGGWNFEIDDPYWGDLNAVRACYLEVKKQITVLVAELTSLKEAPPESLLKKRCIAR